jgi:hypothetical protein
MKKYNWKNWNKGDRVKINPDYNWSFPKSPSVLNREGTVTGVEAHRLYVKWDDQFKESTYTYADHSLVKVDKLFQALPDELFEI